MRKDSYDMLILDWQVVDLSGAEVLRRVRDKLTDNAPVMFMTTSSGEDDIDKQLKELSSSSAVDDDLAKMRAEIGAGDGGGAWGVIEAAMAAGSESHEIYLEVLSPAMASIGQRWARGEIDVSVEHRASGIAMRIIGRMGPRFNRRGRSKGTVIVGAPTGERHNLPVAMVADLVRQGGWEVSDLGVDTPAGSFVLAAGDTDDLVAVGISVTTPECLDAAVEALAGLRTAFGPDLLLFVGGRAVADMDHAITLGANGWAADGVGLVALLEHQTRKRSRSKGVHDEVAVDN